MTDTEKIKALELALRSQIKWYKEIEADEDYDDSYTYDMAHEEFDRGSCCEVLAILSS